MEIAKNIVAALEFANNKHATQTRKVTGEPYMKHIYDVARILMQENCNQTTIIAGILHDTIEDTNTTQQEILSNFGKQVLQLVLYQTENKNLEYKQRKQDKISQLKNAPTEAKKIKCADMLANITDMLQAFDNMGNKLWQYFNGTKQALNWYYTSMLESMAEISHLPMYKLLTSRVHKMFAA